MFDKLLAKLRPEPEVYVPDDEDEAEYFDPGYDVSDEPATLPGHPVVNPNG